MNGRRAHDAKVATASSASGTCCFAIVSPSSNISHGICFLDPINAWCLGWTTSHTSALRTCRSLGHASAGGAPLKENGRIREDHFPYLPRQNGHRDCLSLNQGNLEQSGRLSRWKYFPCTVHRYTDWSGRSVAGHCLCWGRDSRRRLIYNIVSQYLIKDSSRIQLYTLNTII